MNKPDDFDRLNRMTDVSTDESLANGETPYTWRAVSYGVQLTPEYAASIEEKLGMSLEEVVKRL